MTGQWGQINQTEKDIAYITDDLHYIERKCGIETRDRIVRIIKTLKRHHNVGITGLVELWGKRCPVCADPL